MGKAYDDLLDGLSRIVADAVANEDDFRAEAKELNKKMVELLAEQVDELLDVYAVYSDDEIVEPVHDYVTPTPGAPRGSFVIEESGPVSEETWDDLAKWTASHRGY